MWRVGGAAPNSVPSTLAVAGRLIGHDLLADADVRASLAPIGWWIGADDLLPETHVLFGLARGNDRLVGFGIDPRRPPSAVVAEVAGRVQDHLLGYEFLHWPKCAVDGRPMKPVTTAETAVWTCGHETIAIGSLT